METETGFYILEWRIENLSHWRKQVHGDCIKSPEFCNPCSYMELYPKGIRGRGEHLVVRLCGVIAFYFSGEISYYSSNGSLLCSEQQVNREKEGIVLTLPPGPRFEDMLSRIREVEDFITVKIRGNDSLCYEKRMCTTIDVIKISLEMKPGWIEKMKSDAIKDVCYINFSPDNYFERMELNTCSKNNIVHFKIKPQIKCEELAVEMCMRLTGSDGTVDSCVKKEHVFRDDEPWTFPYLLSKKKLVGKRISFFMCLKTRKLIQSLYYVNYENRSINIQTNNTIWISKKEPFTDPVTSNKVAVLTKDSGIHTSLTSDKPDDSVLVLSNELMWLYLNEEFSDFHLKCEDVTFNVHRAILSARSPVFKTMLSTDMAEAASSEVEIGDLDPSTLSLFLAYLYTGAIEEELQCDRAIKLYYAADKYQVTSLKKECLKFLCSNVSLSNVCDILSLADKHQDVELTASSHDFILDNYNDVLKSKEWESFMCRESFLAVKTVTHFATIDSVKKAK